MFKYSNLIENRAKSLSKQEDISLHQAYKNIASDCGFQNTHEMEAALNRSPVEERVIKAAFYYNSCLDDFISDNELHPDLLQFIDLSLAEDIATTNAYNFELDIEHIEFLSYDENYGALSLEMHFRYIGEQDTDAMYSGSVINAVMSLVLRVSGNSWELDQDASKIISAELDTQHPDFYG